MTREVLVRLNEVGYSFGRKRVLSKVSLEVRSGEILGVAGPNGGGKSTLLMLIAGLLQPVEGAVTVLGEPANRVRFSRPGSVGLVLAQPGFFPLLTGWENLAHFGGAYHLSVEALRGRTAMLLKTLGLSAVMDEPFARWSSGMQQKLSVVRALMLSPKVLLFDEPTANLDPLSAKMLYTLLREQARDHDLACVLVTHDLSALEWTCDRALIISGCAWEEVTLSNDSASPWKGPLVDALTRLGGVT